MSGALFVPQLQRSVATKPLLMCRVAGNHCVLLEEYCLQVKKCMNDGERRTQVRTRSWSEAAMPWSSQESRSKCETGARDFLSLNA